MAQTNKWQVQLKNARQKRTFYKQLLIDKIQSHRHKEARLQISGLDGGIKKITQDNLRHI